MCHHSSFGIIDGKWVNVQIPPSSFLALGRTNRSLVLPPTSGVIETESLPNMSANNDIVEIPTSSFYSVGKNIYEKGARLYNLVAF